ncbi:glycosyltransferase family 2 protein [Clostridium sp.]|jgi:poly-beta-1,6-N-acetyl-D-glucosamine synthase|uniref:glycosyltransferase family 2 protein n=1 Tax=Clostridium sp. TaxID=1506 RepID=UPI0039F5F4F5
MYINTNLKKNLKHKKKLYIAVPTKFLISHIFSFIWTSFSIYISIDWVKDFSQIVPLHAAIIIIAGIAYIPGYINAFLVISLLLDRQPAFKNLYPTDEITILIAARNEADKIENTIKYIAKQDYTGQYKVIVIDNGSTDATASIAIEAGERFNVYVSVIREDNPGKFIALNTGIKHVDTEYIITLDADTLLHKSALRYLVARIKSAPNDISAVAGSVLVRNSRDSLITKVQEWDYFLAIASIKRLQGLYQGTLVAQGAYSIYKTKNIKEIGGWPDAIGEDIVLTWTMLSKGWKIYFEPLAVAFTDVPTDLYAFSRQRSRWARGMIEALKLIKPWHQPYAYTKYLTGINFIMPYIDFAYTFCWIPGLVLALFGIYWIVGPMTLLVLPLTLLSYTLLYIYQKHVFKSLNLKIRKNYLGFFIFILFYQMIMSPISVLGYLQEFFKLKRVWE